MSCFIYMSAARSENIPPECRNSSCPAALVRPLQETVVKFAVASPGAAEHLIQMELFEPEIGANCFLVFFLQIIAIKHFTVAARAEFAQDAACDGPLLLPQQALELAGGRGSFLGAGLRFEPRAVVTLEH